MILSLHGNFIPESDYVMAEAIVHEGDDFHVGTISSGTISLIHHVSTPTNIHDSFIATIQIEDKHRKENGSIAIAFNHPVRSINLELYGSVWVSGVLYTSRAEVLEEPPISNLPENPLPSVEQDTIPTGETDIITQKVNPVIIDIDFLEYESVTDNNLQYSGGGNRLLPVENQLVLQNLNEMPVKLEAQSYVENLGANLVPNPAYGLNTNGLPTGWSVSAPNAVVTNRLMNDVSQAARTWGVRFRDNKVNQSRNSVFITSNAINISPTAGDITFSLLGSLKYNTKNSNISMVVLTVYFQDTNSVVLSTVKKEIGATDLVNTFSLLYTTIKQASIPLNSVKVVLQIELYSVDQGDDIEFFSLVPQLEYNGTPTSRTLGIRQMDLYHVATTTENKGSIYLEHVFGYSDKPNYDSYLFSNVALGNGLELSHGSGDGKLCFNVWQNGASSPLVSSVFDPNYEAHQIYASWDNGNHQRSIWVDNIKLAESLVGFPIQATPISNDMYICSNSSGNQNIGEILSFKVLRDYKDI